MAERDDGSAIPGPLGPIFADWRSAIAGVSPDETRRAGELIASELGAPTDAGSFAGIQRELASLVTASDDLARRLRALLSNVETLERNWVTAHRWEPDGLAALRQELEELVTERPADAARRWLNEIIDAFRAREWHPLEAIARWELPFPPDLEQGAADVRAAHAMWGEGSASAPLELWTKVARGELPGWGTTLDVPLRCRAHRVASWIALRHLHDLERARDHLDRAVELDPYSGPNFAERAAFFLSVNDLDEAASDAQRAVELSPQDPAGYIQLGAWAELSGQFDDARELFRQALERMSTDTIAGMSTRQSLLDASGSLLAAAADALLQAGRPTDALSAADAALAAGVRGVQAYPDADAYRIRSQALAESASQGEAADAAIEAGKRYLWNRDTAAAVEQLRRGLELGATHGEAGWLLADALSAQSFPAGAAEPSQEVVALARAAWEEWSAKVGPPAGTAAWAYITRAEIAGNETYDAERTDDAPRWQAVADVERALVHNDSLGHWWGFAAKYLRDAGLEELGFEASERAAELGSTARNALTERLALLANRGRFAEASAVAEEIVEMYGSDAWVSGVQAWLAYHEGRFEEALPFFEDPLAANYDLAWYYNLRAFCHLALGNVTAALADFRSTTEKGAIGTGAAKGELATANSALRNVGEARDWLERARDDPTTTPLQIKTCEAQIALADGDVAAAISSLEAAVGETMNQRELDDLSNDTLLFLTAVGADESRREQVREAIAEPIRARSAWLAEHPATADAELADRLERVTTGASGSDLTPAETALLAVAGRRAAQAGDLDGAAERYQRLRSSWFEPEAAIALARVLSDLSTAAASRGDVERVRSLEEARLAVGAVDRVGVALAVSYALEAANRIGEARAELTALLESAEERRRDALHTRLGELALGDGDLVAARDEFTSALEIAKNASDGSRVAQVETRLLLVALVAGDASAADHLNAALAAWSGVGAFEPVGTFMEEVRGLLATGRSGEVLERARGELESLLEHVAGYAGTDPKRFSSLLATELADSGDNGA